MTTLAAPQELDPPDPTAPLGRPFWRLWGATEVSSLGDGVVMVGFPLLALTLTHRPLLIAGVAIAERLPALLLSLPVGGLADRMDRRRLVVLSTVLRAGALAIFAALVVAGTDTLFALYAAVFALGTGELVFDLATQACLPTLIPPSRLGQANSRLFAAEVSNEQFVGPAIGGVVFAAASSLPFVGDAVSFVAATLLLRRVPMGGDDRGGARPALARDVVEGLRWFLSHRLLRLLAVVVASLAFCQAMSLSLLVLYGVEQLHLSRVGYGVFLALAAIGNLTGALLAGRVHRWLGTSGCIVVAATIAGGAYLVMSVTASAAVATVALAAEGFGVGIGNVTTLSLRQRLIPSALLGRVGSAFRLLIYGLIPLGALTGGLVSGAIGIRASLEIAGWLQLGVFAVAAPALVRRVRAAEDDEEEKGADPRGRQRRGAGQGGRRDSGRLHGRRQHGVRLDGVRLDGVQRHGRRPQARRLHSRRQGDARRAHARQAAARLFAARMIAARQAAARQAARPPVPRPSGGPEDGGASTTPAAMG